MVLVEERSWLLDCRLVCEHTTLEKQQKSHYNIQIY